MKRLSFALLSLLALPAFATDHPGKPGLWEYSVQSRMNGMPFPMPPHTTRQCLTPEVMARNHGAPSTQGRPGSECQVDSSKVSGSTVTWTMSCKGSQSMHGDGSVTYDSDSAYHGQLRMVMNMNGQQQEMTQTMQGKRIGDCH